MGDMDWTRIQKETIVTFWGQLRNFTGLNYRYQDILVHFLRCDKVIVLTWGTVLGRCMPGVQEMKYHDIFNLNSNKEIYEHMTKVSIKQMWKNVNS